jgi:hypothetical protein
MQRAGTHRERLERADDEMQASGAVIGESKDGVSSVELPRPYLTDNVRIIV